MMQETREEIRAEADLEALLDSLQRERDPHARLLLLERLHPAHVRAVDRLAQVRSQRGSGEALAVRLNDLVARSSRVLYAPRHAGVADAALWLRTELLGQLSTARPFLAAAALILAGGVLAGFAAFDTNSKILRLILPLGSVTLAGNPYSTGASSRPDLLSGFLLFDPYLGALLLAGTGILWGVGPLLGLFWLGLQMGGLARMYYHTRELLAFGTWCLTGGLATTCIFLLCGAAGLALGYGVLAPGALSRRRALGLRARQAAALLMACLPVLALEALVILLG